MAKKKRPAGRPKYKPTTRLEDARRVVRAWYIDRVEHGHARYRAVGAIPVLVQGKSTEKPWRTAYHSLDGDGELIPVTANGTETRPKPSARPLRQPLDVDAAGHYLIDPELVFANKAMAMVAVVKAEYHPSVEMWAAGYTGKDIAQEIGCSEPVALGYVEAGLAVVQALSVLKSW